MPPFVLYVHNGNLINVKLVFSEQTYFILDMYVLNAYVHTNKHVLCIYVPASLPPKSDNFIQSMSFLQLELNHRYHVLFYGDTVTFLRLARNYHVK